MVNKEIVVLIGNIGSGKSTLSSEYQKKEYVIISRDRLRYAIGGGIYLFDENYENIIKNTELVMFMGFLEKNINVVIDNGGCLKKDTRKIYIEIGKKYDYYIKYVVLPQFTMEQCIDQRMKNPHGVFDRKFWEEAWKKLDEIYSPPSLEEDVHEIIYLDQNREVSYINRAKM